MPHVHLVPLNVGYKLSDLNYPQPRGTPPTTTWRSGWADTTCICSTMQRLVSGVGCMRSPNIETGRVILGLTTGAGLLPNALVRGFVQRPPIGGQQNPEAQNRESPIVLTFSLGYPPSQLGMGSENDSCSCVLHMSTDGSRPPNPTTPFILDFIVTAL